MEERFWVESYLAKQLLTVVRFGGLSLLQLLPLVQEILQSIHLSDARLAISYQWIHLHRLVSDPFGHQMYSEPKR